MADRLTLARISPTARSILARLSLANFGGAALVFVYLTFVVPSAPTGKAAIDPHHRLSLLLFVAYIVAVLPVTTMQALRRLAPVDHWQASREPADERIQRVLLAQPMRQAVTAFSYWVVAAAVFGAFNGFVLRAEVAVTLRIVLGVILGGMVCCALAYLLIEQFLRPLYARALGDSPPPRPFALRIQTRMLVFWALGSGIPLLGVALAPLGVSRTLRTHLVAPSVFLAITGLAGGGLIIAIAARSVADPLADLRRAIRRVQDGDLDVSVDVDDGGEVGLLQAGFNQMVEGLRERQRLADLFGRHVGPEVARLALERGPEFVGEQRVVSALFIDLIGSTTLAQERPAAEVVAVLNSLFDAVVEVVTAEGGWVNKFEGDGAVCVFGALSTQPDHAARALRSARFLHAAVNERARTHEALDAAVGVSTGRAVAGNIGAVERFEYTVIGDAVNEASRLSELAKGRPGRVLASEAAVIAADGQAGEWEPDGEVTLRGRRQPTRAYRPV